MNTPTPDAGQLKRYDLDPFGRCDGESGCCLASMVDRPDGDWVSYEDYAKLLATPATPAATTESLREAIESALHRTCRVNNDHIEYVTDALLKVLSPLPEQAGRDGEALMTNEAADRFWEVWAAPNGITNLHDRMRVTFKAALIAGHAARAAQQRTPLEKNGGEA